MICKQVLTDSTLLQTCNFHLKELPSAVTDAMPVVGDAQSVQLFRSGRSFLLPPLFPLLPPPPPPIVMPFSFLRGGAVFQELSPVDIFTSEPVAAPRAVAAFTVSFRPSTSEPFIAAIADWADSLFEYVTNPKPRGRPVALWQAVGNSSKVYGNFLPVFSQVNTNDFTESPKP